MVSLEGKTCEQKKAVSTSQENHLHKPELIILLKKKFLLDGKELSLAGVCEKCKTVFFTTQKISCPLTRITSFFQNYFLLISIMVSTSSKIVLTKKKYCFY